MNKRVISGLIILIFGISLIVVSIFSSFVLLIYGIPLLIVGVIIFLNNKEDEIEQIKFGGKVK